MAHRQRRPTSARNAVSETHTGTRHAHMNVADHLYTNSSHQTQTHSLTQHNQTQTHSNGVPRPKTAFKTGIVSGNPIPHRIVEDHHYREDQHFLPWNKYIELDLPPTRQGIASHPTVIEANQHLQTQELQPLWTRVSTTPFTRKALLCGGMGRRITVNKIMQHIRIRIYVYICIYIIIIIIIMSECDVSELDGIG